jgi:putative ABC transport system ATP-binding protein
MASTTEAPDTTAPLIELRDVSRLFTLGGDTVHAVAGANLAIRRGEYCSIMGPSGSGKSTLLNLIALLDRPTSGRYLLNGSDVTALSDDELAAVRNRTIGFVFQSFHLVPRLTAAQNIELPLLLAGVGGRERTERVCAELAALGLTERATHRPAELSGGQRQRVAIARAMIMRPPLLLADEPTGNLDSASGAQVIDILEGLQREQQVTLVIVTHDAALGARAHRHLGIVDGRIASDSTTTALGTP